MLDFNGFVGSWPYWDNPHRTATSVLQMMDRHNIRTLAICSTRAIFHDWRKGNEETIETARANPDRFVAFASISPILTGRELSRLIEGYHRVGVRGLRLYPQHQAYSLSQNTDMAFAMEAAQALNMPVVLPVRVIMHWGLPQLDLGTIETVIQRYPKLRFVLSGLNYDMTLAAFDLMRRHVNVSLEISGLQGFRAVERAVAAVGANAVLFGTGLPLLYPACSIEKLRVAKLDSVARQSIAEGNAHRLLHKPNE
jgi:predicted TIM-barrel fold metal-dependent hydrolase